MGQGLLGLRRFDPHPDSCHTDVYHRNITHYIRVMPGLPSPESRAGFCTQSTEDAGGRFGASVNSAEQTPTENPHSLQGGRRGRNGTSFPDAFAGGEGRDPSLSNTFQASLCRGPESHVLINKASASRTHTCAGAGLFPGLACHTKPLLQQFLINPQRRHQA